MLVFVSVFRRISRGVPALAIVGIAAVVLGLPPAAGATFLRPSGISPGDSFGGGSFGFGSDNVTLTAFRSDFAERALRDLDLGAPDLPPFPAGFSSRFFRGTHRIRGVSIFDGPETPPWFGAFDAALGLRYFCPIDPPPEIPEPGTAVLLAGGLIALSLARRGRRA
jgi:hypothetical protein